MCCMCEGWRGPAGTATGGRGTRSTGPGILPGGWNTTTGSLSDLYQGFGLRMAVAAAAVVVAVVEVDVLWLWLAVDAGGAGVEHCVSRCSWSCRFSCFAGTETETEQH